jgi:cysteine desulfurase / selenocysteine lyase
MIYLDHAATSWPKPAAVVDAVQRWFIDVGVSADRGDGERCRTARRVVAATRAALAELCGKPSERIAFVSGATEGLNLVLRALLRPNDRVVTTAFEHSSVARPLHALARERDLELLVLPPDGDGGVAPTSLAAALAARPTRLVVATHASNVTGTLLPAADLAATCHRHGALFVLDASQTAGMVELPAAADVVVASGHKALLGPPGIGFVAASIGIDLPPQKQGGTGSSRALDEQPTAWPQAFEAGTPNTPAIFGLHAALHGSTAAVRAERLQRGRERLAQLRAGLLPIAAIRPLPAAGAGVPVLSLLHRDFDPAELGGMLAAADIHARSGHHCAPWVHDWLGTALAGTLRLSPGASTTTAEIDAVVAFLRDL